MSTLDLVASLEARGVSLRAEGGSLIVRPVRAVNAAELAVLRKAKPEVLRLLRGRALGVEWSAVSLYKLDRVLELAVPWSDTRLILAPGCRIARELRNTDPHPGRVWCVCEVLDLLLSGVKPEEARKVAEARIQFDAGPVRLAPPPKGQGETA